MGISGGWTPRVHLFTQSGGKLKFRDEDNVFLPNKSELDQISIGSCNGDFELDEVIKNAADSINKFLKVNNNDYENLEIISSTYSFVNIFVSTIDIIWFDDFIS